MVTFSVYDDESGRVYSEVADIPPLPISFELNAELSALSWEAYDERLPLYEKYADITVDVNDLSITAAARKVAAARPR